jgi:release factor glutamine methyltransferase
MNNLNSALRQLASTTSVPLSELRILAEHATGLSRVQQVTEGQAPLRTAHLNALAALATRRQHGEPIAYLVGHKEFYSRPFQVNPNVLIPRPETEELVEQALAFLAPLANAGHPLRALDLGCGSGAIGITLALELPQLQVLATDLSSAALEMAQHNAKTLCAHNIEFIQSDLFEALTQQTPAAQFNLICSNPPYIEANDPHLRQGDLRFEPQLALTDNGDGLRFYRSIAQHSPALLQPNGAVMVEHGHNQQADVMALFNNGVYRNAQGISDLAGLPRVVMAWV